MLRERAPRPDLLVDLGRNGVERLIKAVVPDGRLAEKVDYDAVYAEMDEFLPAFCRETCNRAVTFAIARTQGVGDYIIDTPDLIGAARSLHAQLKALNDAGEGVRTPTMDNAFSRAVTEAVGRLQTWDPSYEQYDDVKVKDEDSAAK